MTHPQKKIKLKVKGGKEQEFTTRPFTFKIENVIKKRAGDDCYKKIRNGEVVEIEITAQDVINDLPHLLVGDTSVIDLSESEYDAVHDIYVFFLKYKRNAGLRQIELDKANIVSVLNQAQPVLEKMQSITSQKPS